MKRLIPILFATALFTSCEERAEIDLHPQETDLLVVEGIITNQKINHRIRLSHPHQEINGDPIPASGAGMIIAEGNIQYPLTEFPQGSGEYYSEPFRAVFGRVYVLFIQYRGESYFAFDASVPAEPLPEIDIKRVSEEIPAYRLHFEEFGRDPSFINHEISWEGTSFCESGAICQGKVVYYDLNTVDVHELFKPDKTDFIFPINSLIIRTKYSVNENFKNYLRSVLSETEWRGGIFDIQRANAQTNLSEGAIGYFAVSTVVTDTTIVTE